MACVAPRYDTDELGHGQERCRVAGDCARPNLWNRNTSWPTPSGVSIKASSRTSVRTEAEWSSRLKARSTGGLPDRPCAGFSLTPPRASVPQTSGKARRTSTLSGSPGSREAPGHLLPNTFDRKLRFLLLLSNPLFANGLPQAKKASNRQPLLTEFSSDLHQDRPASCTGGAPSGVATQCINGCRCSPRSPSAETPGRGFRPRSARRCRAP